MSDNFTDSEQNIVRVPRQMVKAVRRFIQDFPETNELFDGEETAEQTIAQYIVDEVDMWNATPPTTSSSMINTVSLVANPRLSGVKVHIQNAAAARVLKSVKIKLQRNDMPYTVGNVTEQPNAVWRNLESTIQDIELQYREFRQNYKISKNAEAAYGSIHSELYAGFYNNRSGYVVVHI